MKKFQRLILILISLTSLALFLIYRHQYNRLRHVLEVFNFFGTPCNVTELQRSEGLLVEHDWGPQPVWQEVDSKGFIYSAFLQEKHKVQGIGIRHASVAVPKSCFLLFEDDNKPSKNKLTVSKILEDKTTGFLAYIYTCQFTKNDKRPYAIAFKSLSGPKFVTTLLTDNLDKKFSFNSTICLLPIASQFSKKSVIEFLSFHHLLGVESFIVYYEQNFSYKLMKLLKNLSNTLNMWINFYPYNLPLFVPKNFTNILIELDCQLRTKNQSKYSITLGTNDYVVPSLDNSKTTILKIPIKKFCLNHSNVNRPMVLQNFDSIDDFQFNDVIKLNKFKSLNYTKFVNVFDIDCVIYRYEKCERGIKTKTDFSMKRFSTDLTRSTLVQLLIHEEV
ncbi:unnamed protein product [Ceutorhynchus assimilis]|uniref:Glycosyltransferase family 92 protein n=1 Tax=Ceutorhynchus assimilis TaxID=467358 RepID=A0A9N9MMJ3_9CUCU|nr:unnamed protein product [Ceutorhynchus assimilis]